MSLSVGRLQVEVGADTSAAERGLASLGKKLNSLGGLATTAATAIGGVGLMAAGGVALGFGAAVKAATDYETKLSSIKAVSGANGDEMKSLSGLALQLGKDTSFSASTAAEGIEELIKGGLSIQDVMGGGAKAALDLAAAGSISVADAAEIASNAVGQFGLKGSELGHVADMIAGAANASSLSVGDFKYSLSAAGAVAATVGFGFDDLSVAIAEMGKAGIKGSDAGTSLKTFMMNLQPSTDKAAAAMEELGLITADGANRFFDAQGKIKPMVEVQGLLHEATKGLTEQQKLATLETIFGSDAIRAAAVLAKEGATGYNEMAGAMGKVTAAAVGAEKLNNLGGSLEQLKGSAETAAITLGVALTPALKGIVDGATSLLNNAMPAIEGFATGLNQAISNVITGFKLEGLSGAAKVFVNELLTALGLDESAADAVSERVAGIINGIQSTVQSILIGWQSGGLAGAAGTGASILAKMLGFSPEAVTHISNTVSDVITNIKREVDGFTATIRGLASAYQESGIGGVLDSLFGAGTMAAAQELGNTIRDYVVPGFQMLFGAAQSAQGSMAQTETRSISLRDVLIFLSDRIKNVGEAFEILGGLGDLVVIMIGQVGQKFSELGTSADTLRTTISQRFNEIGTAASNLEAAIDTFKSDVGQKFSDLGTAADALKRTIGEKFSDLGTAASNLRTTIGDRFSEIGTAADQLKRNVGQSFDDLGTNARRMTDNVGEDFSRFGTNANQLREDAGRAFDNLGTNVQRVWGDIQTGTGDTWRSVETTITDTISRLKTTAEGWATSAQDAFSRPMNWFRDNAGQIMRTAGNNLLTPLNLSLRGMGVFVGAVRGAINWIADKLGLGEVIGGNWTVPEIPMLARGSQNFQGGPAIVGEQGPELVYLPKGSMVIPNKESMAMLQAAGIPGFQGGLNWPMPPLGSRFSLGSEWSSGRYRLYNPYGPSDNPVYAHVGAFHPGWDITAGGDAPIYAANSGTVRVTEENTPSVVANIGGGTIALNHGGYDTIYAHLGRILVSSRP